MINDGSSFTNDIDFQEHLQDILQSTHDAHTRYSKPVCYNTVFIQPFALDIKVEEDTDGVVTEPKAYVMSNIYTSEYSKMYPESTVSTDDFIGKEISLLNGLEFTTEISTWSDQ